MPELTDVQVQRGKDLTPFRERRELMKDLKGLTQEKAAKILGVHRSTYHDWEMGKREVPRSHRERFKKFLLVDLELNGKPKELEPILNAINTAWEWNLSINELTTRFRKGQKGTAQITPKSIDLIISSVGAKPRIPFLAPVPLRYPLVGRDHLLWDIKQRLLTESSLVVGLTGMPGVGKTALALALAHDPQVKEHFPDGVLWVGLGPKPDVGFGLDAWGSALGISSFDMAKLTSIEEKRNKILESMGTRRLLLVVDGAWQVEAALNFNFTAPNCARIVTTRLRNVAVEMGCEPLIVRELKESASLELLTQIAPEFVKANPGDSRFFVNHAHGLPLFVLVIGESFRAELEELRRKGLGEDPSAVSERIFWHNRNFYQLYTTPMFDEPMEYHPELRRNPVNVYDNFRVSLDALDPDALQALVPLASKALQTNSKAISEEASLQLAGKPAGTLSMLVNHGLVDRNSQGEYTVPEAIAYCMFVHGMRPIPVIP